MIGLLSHHTWVVCEKFVVVDHRSPTACGTPTAFNNLGLMLQSNMLQYFYVDKADDLFKLVSKGSFKKMFLLLLALGPNLLETHHSHAQCVLPLPAAA